MNEFESYLFGLILTDGSIYLTTRNRGRVTIEIQASDRELLEKISDSIPDSKIDTRKRDTNFKDNYESVIWSNHQLSFRKWIFDCGMPKRDKGIIGNIPSVDFSEPDFWRGVIDGNGSIGFTKNGEPFISLATASKNLKDSILKLFLSKFNIKKVINPNKRDHVYNIVLKNEEAIMFCDFLYDNAEVYLKRKHDKYLEIKKWKRTKKKLNPQSWSENEIEYIKNHTVEESMTALKRTKSSIKAKLWRLKTK